MDPSSFFETRNDGELLRERAISYVETYQKVNVPAGNTKNSTPKYFGISEVFFANISEKTDEFFRAIE